MSGTNKLSGISTPADSIISPKKRSKNLPAAARRRFPQMKSQATTKYWRAYSLLPVNVQRIALKQHRLWLHDPRHPSINFKKVGRYWSARITDDYRALGVMRGDTVIWFWIGPHADYVRIIEK